jgi:hypothetical protein
MQRGCDASINWRPGAWRCMDASMDRSILWRVHVVKCRGDSPWRVSACRQNLWGAGTACRFDRPSTAGVHMQGQWGASSLKGSTATSTGSNHSFLSLSHFHVSTGHQGHPGTPMNDKARVASPYTSHQGPDRSHGTFIFRHPGRRDDEHGVCGVLLLVSPTAVPKIGSELCTSRPLHPPPFALHTSQSTPYHPPGSVKPLLRCCASNALDPDDTFKISIACSFE